MLSELSSMGLMSKVASSTTRWISNFRMTHGYDHAAWDDVVLSWVTVVRGKLQEMNDVSIGKQVSPFFSVSGNQDKKTTQSQKLLVE